MREPVNILLVDDQPARLDAREDPSSLPCCSTPAAVTVALPAQGEAESKGDEVQIGVRDHQ